MASPAVPLSNPPSRLPETIPPELVSLDQWVLYRIEKRAERSTKVPYQPNGITASTTDSNTWSSLAVVLEKQREFDGVGFVFNENGIVGIDLDNCFSNKQLTPEALEIVELLSSYTEISPSGNGLHIFVKGQMPTGAPKRKGKIEVYEKGRYFTVTGNILGQHTEIKDRQEELEQLIAKYLSPTKPNKPLSLVQDEEPSSPSLTDDEVLSLCRRASNREKFSRLFDRAEFPEGKYSEAVQSLLGMLVFYTQNREQLARLFESSALHSGHWIQKWDRLKNSEIDTALQFNSEQYRPRGKRGEPSEAKQEASDDARFATTDLGNAERFVNQFGDRVRWVDDQKLFYVYTGEVWKVSRHHLMELVSECLRSILIEAYQEQDGRERNNLIKWARSCQTKGRAEGLLHFAPGKKEILVSKAQEFDQNRHLLNCKNGTLNLKTGKLQEFNPNDLITLRINAAYIPGSPCTEWQKFLDSTFLGDRDLIEFVQRALGYSLTGECTERVMFVLYGGGKNGKSTMCETISHIMGDYSAELNTDALLRKEMTGGIPNDIARLRGTRFVCANETEEGRRLNEPRVKELTGNDRISARFMRSEWFDFKPEFKLWMRTNHKPEIHGTDPAIWDRIRLIPFNARFDGNPDLKLQEKLLKEAEGIFAWMVEGAIRWQQEGLNLPGAVKEATEGYRKENDILGDFLTAKVEKTPGLDLSNKDLLAAFNRWLKTENRPEVSGKALARKMTERGYQGEERRGIKWWIGIRLTTQEEDFTGGEPW
jgi:putative DNA primase/helicase